MKGKLQEGPPPTHPTPVISEYLLDPSQQKSQEQNLQQKLLDDQFSILQGTVKEAESIIQDAVAKLDDPLHIRCTSSPGGPRVSQSGHMCAHARERELF